jgi:hypothetical protein
LCKLLLAVLGDEVVFDVDELTLGIDPLESVAAVSVLVAPTFWGAMIAEEHETGMVTFWGVCEQVEQRIVIREEVLGVAGLRANDIWALDRVAAKEDRLRVLAMKH